MLHRYKKIITNYSRRNAVKAFLRLFLCASGVITWHVTHILKMEAECFMECWTDCHGCG